MNKCPQCNQPRKADEYRCLKCGCFYSQLDEILANEETEIEKKSFKGRLKRIRQASSPQQALIDEFRAVKASAPPRSFFTLGLIFIFIFALIVSVL